MYRTSNKFNKEEIRDLFSGQFNNGEIEFYNDENYNQVHNMRQRDLRPGAKNNNDNSQDNISLNNSDLEPNNSEIDGLSIDQKMA